MPMHIEQPGSRPTGNDRPAGRVAGGETEGARQRFAVRARDAVVRVTVRQPEASRLAPRALGCCLVGANRFLQTGDVLFREQVSVCTEQRRRFTHRRERGVDVRRSRERCRLERRRHPRQGDSRASRTGVTGEPLSNWNVNAD